MASQILALKIAIAIFILVCILHVIRIILKVKVSIGNLDVPLWLSAVGAIVSLSLSLWMISVLK